MEKVKHILCSYALDLIMGVGAAAVTIGAGMIYLPAGWIVGGALVIAGAGINSLSGGGDEEQ